MPYSVLESRFKALEAKGLEGFFAYWGLPIRDPEAEGFGQYGPCERANAFMAIMAASNPIGQMLLEQEIENPFTKGFLGMQHPNKLLDGTEGEPLKMYSFATRDAKNCYIFFSLKQVCHHHYVTHVTGFPESGLVQRFLESQAK